MSFQPEPAFNGSASGRALASTGFAHRLWPNVAAAVLLALALASLAPAARAVINPHFTPVDLVKGAAQVQWLRISGPQNQLVSAEVVETLKGKAEAKQLAFELGDELEEGDVRAAFGGKKTTSAILFLSDRGHKDADDEPDGALEIETFWFAVFRKDGKLILDKDQRQLFAVWAGSARMLAAATRYVQSEPAAKFPVRSEMTWGESLKLGKLTGPAYRCLAADLGKPNGLCALVLSEAGDRVYQAATENGKPSEVTAQTKLSTASKAAAVGDFDGDGRMDLLSWDGRALKLAIQKAEGTFAAPKECGKLAECLSLDCIAARGARPALVAGTSEGPVLLAWDPAGTLQTQALDKVTKLGPGGFCVIADCNNDGRSDVMALFTKGALLYAGEGAGRFKAPQQIALTLVDQPRAGMCGDYDGDGLLDVIVAGQDGLVLLSREAADQWSNLTYLTGELAYHGNANRPEVRACAPCDVNTDGRQGMALFYSDRKPLLFFNRGFACFGWARELDFDPATASSEMSPGEDTSSQPKLAGGGPEDLKQGQVAGVLMDLNRDGVPDMLAVGAKEREVWTVCGRRAEGQAARTCLLVLPASASGPVTVTVRDEGRSAGMYVVRPGMPAVVGRAEPGPMTLAWIGLDGKTVSRNVTVIDEGSRFEIKP